MKEDAFYEASTFQGDGTTIKYDPTKPNRSDAVGKAYKRNANGTYSLVSDGDEVEGIVIAVTSNNKFTGAYLFGGLLFPIGHGQTVTRDSKIVGALGPSSAKGYVKSAPALPSDLSTLAATDIDSDAEKLTVHNAARTAINALIGNAKGKGKILDFDTTQALVAFGGA